MSKSKKGAPDDMFMSCLPGGNRKRRRHVKEWMLRRAYYGTKLDRELKDARDRAAARKRGDIEDLCGNNTKDLGGIQSADPGEI